MPFTCSAENYGGRRFSSSLAPSGLTWNRLENTPAGFIPAEDQGWFFTYVELPSGAALSRTEAMTGQSSEIICKNPAVENCMAISGYSFLNGVAESNAGVLS